VLACLADASPTSTRLVDRIYPIWIQPCDLPRGLTVEAHLAKIRQESKA